MSTMYTRLKILQNQFKKISTSYFSIPQVAESVRLQAELHEKEKLILRQQRQRCKKVYKDLESLRTKMSDAQGKWNSEDPNNITKLMLNY